MYTDLPSIQEATSQIALQERLDAICEIVKILTPLHPPDRARVVNCALRFFEDNTRT